VFQSRVFGGGFGFTVVFAFFVIWILQWVALSGWLLATLGLAPTFLGLGVTTGIDAFTKIGTWAVTTNGIIIVSIANALVALALLVSGFRNYVRFQYVMWYAVLISFGVALVLLFTSNPAAAHARLDAFAGSVDGVTNFFAKAKEGALAAGLTNFHPPFWLVGTLLSAPIVWTSLQWASYSVEQGGEIKNAHVFRNQLFIIVGSLAATALCLVLLGLALEHGVGRDGVLVASSGFWLGNSSAVIGGTVMAPDLIAIALTGSWLIALVVGIGFILNSFQIVCNCYIGTTRIMVAQGLDGLLPDWFSRVNARWKTPANAHVAYFLGAIPVIFAFNKIADWSTKWALGVTFANGVVFMFAPLAAAMLPFRAKKLYEASPGSKYKLGNVPLVTVFGVIGFLTATFMVGAFLFVKDLGLAYSGHGIVYAVVVGTVVVGLAVYLIMRWVKRSQGIKVEYAFAEIPPE
ncbi:MAG TPA: hypothetical protein VEN95_07675, partial [Actinomycetota bacterium]|nr:hypothetical protein [Actinomycetota bacterium]